MAALRSLSDGLRSLFRREQVNRELDEELKGFLEMAAEEKVKQGMNRKDALRAVRLESGNLEVTKETVRSAGWEFVLETCCQDLRYAFRTLRKSPGFTATAIFTKRAERDRKSTRLNSSHGYISYAVFCLKKKNNRLYTLHA